MVAATGVVALYGRFRGLRHRVFRLATGSRPCRLESLVCPGVGADTLGDIYTQPADPCVDRHAQHLYGLHTPTLAPIQPVADYRVRPAWAWPLGSANITGSSEMSHQDTLCGVNLHE